VYSKRMRSKVNSYIAILFITILGGGAALIIVHVATDSVIAATFGTSGGLNYAALQQSILKSRSNR